MAEKVTLSLGVDALAAPAPAEYAGMSLSDWLDRAVWLAATLDSGWSDLFNAA